MAILTMMLGLPRSGKTTWIEKNLEDNIVVSNDWIREKILHAPYSKAIYPAIWMITDATLRILLSQGKNCILDGVNATKYEREFFVDLARECGAQIRMIYINILLETCLERNRTQQGAKLPEEKLRSMAQRFEIPSKNEYDYLYLVNHVQAV